jgi:hypothetical protein
MSPKTKTNKTVKNPSIIKSKRHLRNWHRMPKRIQKYVIEQVSAGRTCVSLARELKMSSMGIHCFLKRRGLSVSDLRKKNSCSIESWPVNVMEAPKVPESIYVVNLTPNGKSISSNLAFYLGVTQEEVVEAAFVKYHELQKSIVREMLAKG